MLRTVKLRMFPTEEQAKLIDSYIHMTRFVYNWALERSQKYYEETGKRMTAYDLEKELTQLKKEEKYSFLNECDSRSLKCTIKNLELNLISFLQKRQGFPNFKSRKTCKLSYYPKPECTHIKQNYIQLPKIHKKAGLVYIKNSFNIEDKHWLRPTIIKTRSGKYYVNLIYEDGSIGPQPFHIRRNKVGIDVGIRTLCTFNDGTKIDPPKFYKQSDRRIRGLQKSLSRKTRGSNNYEKTRLKLAKAYEKDHDRLQNFVHNLSKHIVDTYDEIHIEDYDALSWNTKNHNINRALLFSGLGELKKQLIYKSEWYDKELIIADKSYPSTQICSNCNFRNESIQTPTITEWDCPNCGCHHDRDVNAAINLVNYYPA